MKKSIALLLVLALTLTLCACTGNTEEAAATPAPTAAPTPEPTPEPTPTWETGYARTSMVGVLYTTLSRGDEVEVIGAEGDYYRVKYKDIELFVERCFVRLDSEDAFIPTKGYGTKNDSPVYFSPYLSSAAITAFDKNEEIKILDMFGLWAWVEVNSIQGCTLAENVTDKEPKVYTGGGGGSSDSGGSSGADGGDIALDFESTGAELVKLASYGSGSEYVSFPEGHAVILGDGVEAYLKILHKGDSYMVTKDVGKLRTVYDGVNSGEVPGWALNMSKDSVFIEWDGFAVKDAAAYDNYRLIGNPVATFEKNTSVHVLFDIGTCYLVTVDGDEYFMPYDMVSETEIKTYSGGGGGGSSGGGAEWSEPVL